MPILSPHPMRRRLLTAACALSAPLPHASAQTRPAAWPGAQAVSFVVPYPAGVAADTLTRAVGERLAETTGGRFITVNRPGAATTVAASFVARQPADGHHVLLGSVTTFCVAPWAYKTPGFDAARDFVHISALGDAFMLLLANPRWKSLDHFLGEARKRPGELAYASLGNGSTVHIAFLDLMARAGISLNHVPYGGSPPALADTVGGRCDVTIAPLVTAKPYLDGGRLVALGNAAGVRARALPELPTLSEIGLPGFRAPAWLSLHAREGTDPGIVTTIEQATREVLTAPAGRAMLDRLSMAEVELGSKALAQRIEEESAHYRVLMARAGIVPE